MYKNNIRNGILNFDMENFFTPRTNDDSNGAILMITSNQVVLALNSNNGEGPHANAFAEAISEIYDLPIKDGTSHSIVPLSTMADHKINARLVNEGAAGTYFAFLLANLKSITSNEFKTFERFYHEYNDIIRKISEQFGFPIIHCIVPNYDENIKNRFTGQMSKSITIESDDLTPVLESLRKLVDKNKNDEEEKKVIELSKEEKSTIYKNTIMRNFKSLLELFERCKQNENNSIILSDFEKSIKQIENEILEKSHDGFTLMEAKNIINSIDILVKNINSSILTQSENQQNEVNQNSK